MDSFYDNNLLNYYTILSIAPVLVVIIVGYDVAAIICNPFAQWSIVHDFTLHIQVQGMDSFGATNLLNYYTTQVLVLYLYS